MPDALRVYLAAIQRELAVGKATAHTHRPALKALIEACGPAQRPRMSPGA